MDAMQPDAASKIRDAFKDRAAQSLCNPVSYLTFILISTARRIEPATKAVNAAYR